MYNGQAAFTIMFRRRPNRMRAIPLAGLVTALFAGTLPAVAQTLPIDMILAPTRPAGAQAFAPSPPHLPTASFHPSRPAVAEIPPSRPVIPRPANAEQVLAVTAPLPPSRPA